jgi:signal transduction histidine kinase
LTALAHSAGWSLAASMAAALSVLVLRNGRRRSAINEALHELRRPLQAVALFGSSPGAVGGSRIEGSIRLAAVALERLDREVNGGVRRPTRESIRGEALLRSAVGRWRPRVALDGGSLELRWWAGEVVLDGDRDGLEGAIDNLIVNAIEHGGAPILVEGRRHGGRLRISVADSGSGSQGPAGRHQPLAALARLTGRRRRGHGLAVVRRVAADHGGRFVLRHSPAGSTAVLELPLRMDAAKRASG